MKAIIPIITLAVAAISADAAPQLSAELQPREISLGESARLAVTLSGSSSGTRPQLPAIDGLQFQAAGQSSQIRIVNGQTTSSVGFTYRVTPERAGEFEIPAITASVAGQELRSEPLKLRVNASSKTAPQPLAQPGTTATTPAGTTPDGLAFLRIERADNGARDHLFVGELTPIAIRAFFREGVQVSQVSKPALDGGAFTLHQLSDEPQQQSATIDGQRYRVLTWFAGLSGVKAGDEKLAATLQATVAVPQPRSRPQGRSPLGGSLFDDPFFDSVFDDFFQRAEQREVALASEAMPLTIRPLPTENRPAGFDGAVGQFKLGSFSIPAELKTGDPIELKVTVAGKGNFDRVTPPQILPGGKWKTYAAKDAIEPGDSIGFEASKTFTLPAIALEPGTMDVSFAFSYFDPSSESYQTASTQAIPVAATGEAVDVTAPADSAVPAATPGAAPGAATDALAPLRELPRNPTANLAPLYTRTWFIALQAVPLGALVASAAIALLRCRQRNPLAARQRATAQAIAASLAALASARQRQDGSAFFASARRALQHRLAEKWGCHPEVITSGEVTQQLGSDSPVARIFAMADAVEFSAMRPDPDSLDGWQARVEAALAELDVREKPQPDLGGHSWGQIHQSA